MVARRSLWWLTGACAALLLFVLHPQSLQRLDLMAYDLLLPQVQLPEQAPVVIAIDDASLMALGRWPWSRRLHAQMLDQLRQAGARSVGLSILFTDPDSEDPEGDALLAQALERQGHAVLAVAPSQQDNGNMGVLPLFDGLKTAKVGHVDVEIDLDGASRSLFLRAGNGQADLPALALAVQPENYAPQSPPPVASMASKAGAWVRADEVLLPRMPNLPTISFAEGLNHPETLAAVRGRAVFIGTTASGLEAPLVSPLARQQSTLPAVVFHAKAYAALSDHAEIHRAAPWLALVLALLSVSSLAFWPVSHGKRLLLAGSLLLLPVLVSALVLQLADIWLPPALALGALLAALVVWVAGSLQVVNRQLLRSRQHAHATLQAIDEAVITVDAKTLAIRSANPAAALQAGESRLRDKPLLTAYPLTQESMERLRLATLDCIQNATRTHLPELLSLHGPSSMRALRATVSPLSTPEGRIDGAVLVFADVTDAVANAIELDHAAKHDALTGLPNRATLHHQLTLTLSRIRRRGGFAALMFLDLDRFKQVNDNLGHRAGDRVLSILAGRLRALCRDTDTVARWGGDEFVLLLEDVAGQEGAALAANKVVDALSQDLELGEDFNHMRLPCAGSIGVVLIPQDGDSVDDLLSKADMAMYRAKKQPQTCFQFWSEDMNARMQNRLALEIDLRQGLREGHFVLHYQPQFAFANQRLVGMEALLRWQRSPGKLVMPGDFIPFAEESDLILDMGAWAVLHATQQIATWLRAGLNPVPVAVNISARQCQNRDIVQVVRVALQESGIPPHLLRLEITETTAMTDADSVIGLLQEIRALGVGLAVDDFGTGYSSLAYLKRFPIDELKIDRSFISDITTNAHDAAIVRSTISLAHGLGLKVVAEGIETEAQRTMLAAKGCDVAQGYLFGRPQPIADVTRLLTNG